MTATDPKSKPRKRSPRRRPKTVKLPSGLGEKIADALETAGWRNGPGTFLQDDDKGWFTVFDKPLRVSDNQVTVVQWAYWTDENDSYQAARRAVGGLELGISGLLIWPSSPGQFPADWNGPEAGSNYYHGSIDVAVMEPGG